MADNAFAIVTATSGKDVLGATDATTDLAWGVFAVPDVSIFCFLSQYNFISHVEKCWY